ncbi:MAG TPA: biotin-independent malonate decarboxylase subunit gamma [Limnobacter sp.]|uniref:biotin-independent malonate decarboxylase subunit gamma n=1 Tax=Limnobacter sp. TaxID=2003368 RepID=UPI002E37301D|nr:biotin-independent malonate decarboxylase subunit gamma [Limnobacter sp.]HEX5486538.1 biotin-independent malonate decarboxylase subunit gamma [Limnobacter sp.]
MKSQQHIIEALFGQSYQALVQADDHFFGNTRINDTPVRVLGTSQRAEIGADLALAMAGQVLDVIKNQPNTVILFLLDTQGQRLRRHDELMGLNGYMAHLAKTVELARQHGHIVLSVVYGEAVSGGYITTGMMADACYGLADAEISVMNLPAMSRITKIPLDRLTALSEQSPVFSPGVNNYFKMGHLQAVWSDHYPQALSNALAQLQAMTPAERARDLRIQTGAERGGRTAAQRVLDLVLGEGSERA